MIEFGQKTADPDPKDLELLKAAKLSNIEYSFAKFWRRDQKLSIKGRISQEFFNTGLAPLSYPQKRPGFFLNTPLYHSSL